MIERWWGVGALALGLLACGGSSTTTAAADAGSGAEAGSGYALPAGCGPAGRTFTCNPLTNAGCATDEECDDDLKGAFKCYPPPNTGTVGSVCDDVAGPSCAGGLACLTADAGTAGVCARYCCTAADCASGQRCVALDPAFGTLGLCQ